MQDGADVTFIHIRRLTLVIVVGLGMAIMLYADPFPFWEYPFSYLVRTVSENGAANQPALIAYTAAMLTGGVVMLGCRRSYRTATGLPYQRAGALLSLAAAVGFFGSVAPSDLLAPVHNLASGMVFGALWLLGVLLLARAGQLHGRAVTVAGHLLLQGTVLPYAAWYFLASPAPSVQKAAVAALILVLLVSSHLTRHASAAEDAMPADAAPVAAPSVESA